MVGLDRIRNIMLGPLKQKGGGGQTGQDGQGGDGQRGVGPAGRGFNCPWSW